MMLGMCARRLALVLVLLPLSLPVACGSAPARAASDDAGAAAALPPPSPFFPADYQGEMFVDLAALRDNGLLDRVVRLPMMNGFVDAVAHQYGCELDDLQCLRTAVVFEPDGGHVYGHSVTEAVVAADARPASLPKPWVATKVGPYDAFCWDGGLKSKPLLFWPRDGVAVNGDHDLIEPIVAGERKAGGPNAQLAPLLVGEHILFQYAFGRFGMPIDRMTGTFGFYWYDPDDPVDFVRVRLAADRDGGLVFSIMFRFQHGTSGLRDVESGVRKKLDEMLGNKEFAVFKPILGAIVLAHQERDLTLSLLLGQPRDAFAKVERAVIALMRMRMDDERARR